MTCRSVERKMQGGRFGTLNCNVGGSLHFYMDASTCVHASS